MLRLLFLLLILGLSFGQTTGKISGVVSDADTGEAIIGANVRISGTNLGAATDVDGFYYIINLDPGIYNIEVRYIGYKTAIRELRVSLNRTTEANIQLNDKKNHLVVSLGKKHGLTLTSLAYTKGTNTPWVLFKVESLTNNTSVLRPLDPRKDISKLDGKMVEFLEVL